MRNFNLTYENTEIFCDNLHLLLSKKFFNECPPKTAEMKNIKILSSYIVHKASFHSHMKLSKTINRIFKGDWSICREVFFYQEGFHKHII